MKTSGKNHPRPLFSLAAPPPATAPTGQKFALAHSRHLPTQRISRHMIKPENAAEILAQLPPPGHCLHTIIRGDFILNDLIVGIVRQASQRAVVAAKWAVLKVGNPTFAPIPPIGGIDRATATATRDEAAKKGQARKPADSVVEKIPQQNESKSRDQAAKAVGVNLSDRALADWCGVSAPTVSDVRCKSFTTEPKEPTYSDGVMPPATKPNIAEEYEKATRTGKDGKQHPVPVLTIGTLSMNPENARELAKLLDEGLVGGITMVISDYFFRTSRDAVEECFQILPAPSTRWIKTRSHAKICLIPTGTDAFVLHGSANLRSSANLENLTIENDRALLDWHAGWIPELTTTL